MIDRELNTYIISSISNLATEATETQRLPNH
jgi:hypothetical protein